MSPVVSGVPLVALPPSVRQRRLDSARAVAHRRRTPLRRRLLAVRCCDPVRGRKEKAGLAPAFLLPWFTVTNCRGGFIVPVSADQSTVAAATRHLGGRHGGFSVDLYRRCGRAAGSRRFERVSFCASQNGQWGLNEREIHRRAEDSQIDKH